MQTSLPSRGAWIEIAKTRFTVLGLVPSLPSRGAWIEMTSQQASNAMYQVAPLTGSVDRNCGRGEQGLDPVVVAPLTGSVDRNSVGALDVLADPVAPLTGSVDRNSIRSARVFR